MKLLFDENLSRNLVVRLAELYPESAHLVEVGLLASPDRDPTRDAEYVLRRDAIRITEFAADHEFGVLGLTQA